MSRLQISAIIVEPEVKEQRKIHQNQTIIKMAFYNSTKTVKFIKEILTVNEIENHYTTDPKSSTKVLCWLLEQI